MNKKARSKLPLKPKSLFKWFLMDIIPSTSPKSLTNDTNFKNYLLIVDAYSKIPKLYGMENINNAEVMDKLDMFQSRFFPNPTNQNGRFFRIWIETCPICPKLL